MAKEPEKKLPDFDPKKIYRVKVKQAVPLPDAEHHILRPSDIDNRVNGDIASQIKAFLLSAEEVGNVEG